MLWDTSIAEWYYPALAEGETHITINRSTAVDVVSRLNDDPARVAALGAAAKKVQAELLSADAIAEHLWNVAELVRKRMGCASILDDADRVLRLAKELGACEHFVRVRVLVAQRYGKYAMPGEGLCAWLQQRSVAPR